MIDNSTALLEARQAEPSTLDPIDLLFNPPRSGGEHQALRLERIMQVRRLIESGEYDNDARLQLALDRMLDEMMG